MINISKLQNHWHYYAFNAISTQKKEISLKNNKRHQSKRHIILSKSLIKFNEINYRKTLIKSVETDSQKITTGEKKETGRIPLDNIETGQIFSGKVTNLTKYGAFVDIGAVGDVLVHISQISTNYVNNPSNYLSKGDEIKLKIISKKDKLEGSIKEAGVKLEPKPGTDEPIQKQQRQTRQPRRQDQEQGDKKNLRGFKTESNMRKRTTSRVKRTPYKLGTEFTGIVDELRPSGVFVLIDNKKTRAYLHISEMETSSLEEKTETIVKEEKTETIVKEEEETVKKEEETEAIVKEEEETVKKEEVEVSKEEIIREKKESEKKIPKILLEKGQEIKVTVIEDDGKRINLSQRNQDDLKMVMEARTEGYTFKSDNFKDIGIVGFALSKAGITRDMFPTIDEGADLTIDFEQKQKEAEEEKAKETVPEASIATEDEKSIVKETKDEIPEKETITDVKEEITVKSEEPSVVESKEIPVVTESKEETIVSKVIEESVQMDSVEEKIDDKEISIADEMEKETKMEDKETIITPEEPKIKEEPEAKEETKKIVKETIITPEEPKIKEETKTIVKETIITPEESEIKEETKTIVKETIITPKEPEIKEETKTIVKETIITPEEPEAKEKTEITQDEKTTLELKEDDDVAKVEAKIEISSEEKVEIKPEAESNVERIPKEEETTIEKEEKSKQVAASEIEKPIETVTEIKKASITAKDVKSLREISGAGMMDCKKALTECNGDMDKAIDYLKKKGISGASKKGSRIASEGIIGTYIHTGAKLGVILEVNCETDFVARSDKFKELVENISMQIAASPEAVCVSVDDVPRELIEKEKEIESQKEDILSKPENIREKIIEGRLQKIKKTFALLEQPYVRDQNKTVNDIIVEMIAILGEKISVRRFERFNLGEGLEKKEANLSLAEEVAKQTEMKKEEPKDTSTTSTEETKSDVKVNNISAKLVKELREVSGAGMMDCKKALSESNGDIKVAMEVLRKKGIAGADKKAGRMASEGIIASYIHTGSRLGVMIEVNCETDFVAREDKFKNLVEDLCLQIAANTEIEYVSMNEIPKERLDKEKEIEMEKEDIKSKPENMQLRIVEGRVKKVAENLALLNQAFVRDPNKTVEELIKENIAILGENIQVRRFVKFNLGEGIEKKHENFADEVASQIKS